MPSISTAPSTALSSHDRICIVAILGASWLLFTFTHDVLVTHEELSVTVPSSGVIVTTSMASSVITSSRFSLIIVIVSSSTALLIETSLFAMHLRLLNFWVFLFSYDFTWSDLLLLHCSLIFLLVFLDWLFFVSFLSFSIFLFLLVFFFLLVLIILVVVGILVFLLGV
jgi:hypothetical protein